MSDIKIVGFIKVIRWMGHPHHLCGYVGVPIEYKDKIKCYDDYNNKTIEFIDSIDYLSKVHGGITYSDIMKCNTDINFMEIIPVGDIPADYNTNKYHYFGFDLNHINDDIVGTALDYQYARENVINLKEAISKILNNK